MATVFDVFKQVEYEYLEISRGTVYGNRVTSSTPLKGVFKLRSGMTQGTRELATSAATIHAHPEDFTDIEAIVGNGVAYGGQTYRISGITAGTNFDNGVTEHLALTLDVESFDNYPLETA